MSTNYISGTANTQNADDSTPADDGPIDYCNTKTVMPNQKKMQKKNEKKSKYKGSEMPENVEPDQEVVVGQETKEDCSQQAEDTEDCPICLDVLPKVSSQFTRLTCCGKGLHDKCAKELATNKSMTLEQKSKCLMCRTKHVERGTKEVIERLRGWVQKGKAWAMCILAQMYRDGEGVKQSDKKSIKFYKMAAKRKHAAAQYALGNYYYNGSTGFKQSYKKAIEYYTLAAKQGDTYAQLNLGAMYKEGDNIEQSNSKARKWWTKAAEQGLAQAQFNLGLDYKNGDSIEQSNSKARKWWTKAAEQGLARAQFNLGTMYKDGDGFKQSNSKAREWWTKAAEQGLARAQFYLGTMYEQGDGIEQSNSKAREWFTKAAAQGYKEANKYLKQLDKKEGVKSSISCSTCGKHKTKDFNIRSCVCRTKHYCNSKCQEKQYKQHKKECKRLVKERKKKNGQNIKRCQK